MSVVETVLSKVDNATVFPVVITNKDVALIEESALVVQALEGNGYKVETFVDIPNQTFGLKVSK